RCLADKVNIRDSVRDEIIDTILILSRGATDWLLPFSDTPLTALGYLMEDQRMVQGLASIAQDKTVDGGIRGSCLNLLQNAYPKDELVRLYLSLLKEEDIDDHVLYEAAMVLRDLDRAEEIENLGFLKIGRGTTIEIWLRFNKNGIVS